MDYSKVLMMGLLKKTGDTPSTRGVDFSSLKDWESSVMKKRGGKRSIIRVTLALKTKRRLGEMFVNKLIRVCKKRLDIFDQAEALARPGVKISDLSLIKFKIAVREAFVEL
jgi:hypothetical protein